MSTIKLPSYYSLPLACVVLLHYKLETYCSRYCRIFHTEQRRTGIKPKYSKAFKAINWMEYKMRPYVRAATKRAKEEYYRNFS